jgi:hypothetical protein
MNPKRPAGPPMTLGNMRELGVYHLILKSFSPPLAATDYEPARNTRLEDVGRKGARFHVHALLD